MTLIYAYQNRGLTRNLQILDSSDAVITPGANDKVRVIIGRDGQTAKLTVTSDDPTANGSSLTKGATNVLRLDASDLGAINPGTYNLYFDYYDNADAQEWKLVSKQIFHLEGTRRIADVSEVLLEAGLSGSVTDEERALVSTFMRRVEGLVRRYLGYDPVCSERTEYYPLAVVGAGGSRTVWEVNDNQAYQRTSSGGQTTELQLKGLPIRSSPAMQLWIDYDGRAGTRVGSFEAEHLKVEGTDYWPNYDGQDADENFVCRDGIVRSQGLWPITPGCVKVVYWAGYSHDEFRGDSNQVDASPILGVVISETLRRVRRRLVRKKGTKIGHAAGAITSESLGDYSYSIDPTKAGVVYVDENLLDGESQFTLCGFRNYGGDEII